MGGSACWAYLCPKMCTTLNDRCFSGQHTSRYWHIPYVFILTSILSRSPFCQKQLKHTSSNQMPTNCLFVTIPWGDPAKLSPLKCSRSSVKVTLNRRLAGGPDCKTCIKLICTTSLASACSLSCKARCCNWLLAIGTCYSTCIWLHVRSLDPVIRLNSLHG